MRTEYQLTGLHLAASCVLFNRLKLSGVARICCEKGQSWKSGHGALTADFRAGYSSCLMTYSFVTNAVLFERAVSCWLCTSWMSQSWAVRFTLKWT